MVSIISHNMCEVNPAACVLQRREQNLWGIMDMMTLPQREWQGQASNSFA